MFNKNNRIVSLEIPPLQFCGYFRQYLNEHPDKDFITFYRRGITLIIKKEEAKKCNKN